MADQQSIYGRGLYGWGMYSDYPWALLAGSMQVVFQTSAKVTKSRSFATSMTVLFQVPLARLSYIGYFDQSSMTVVFGTSARLSESEPLSGSFSVAIGIPNAPLKESHNLRGGFTVGMYFPLARFVMTRMYRAEMDVEFGLIGNFSRLANRAYDGTITVTFNFDSTQLFVDKPLFGEFEVVVDIDSGDWFVGDAWPPVIPPDEPWLPEFPPAGPWIPDGPREGPWTPISASADNWTPIEDTEHFDG